MTLHGPNTTCWLCGGSLTDHARGCPNGWPDYSATDADVFGRTHIPTVHERAESLTDAVELSNELTELRADATERIAEQITQEEYDKLRENAGDAVAEVSSPRAAVREVLYELEKQGFGRSKDGDLYILASGQTRSDLAEGSPALDRNAYVSMDGAPILGTPHLGDDELLGVHTDALRPHPVYSDRVLVIRPAGVVSASIRRFKESHGYVDLGAYEE
jgi:hypothetical protein